MEYKSLGSTGVKVAPLCFGTMTFGDAADAAMSKKIYSTCRDGGINFFDTANGYAKGASEQILGKLIKPHRDQVIVATKVYYPTGEDVNARGLSRFHMTKALENSLKRLGTDYVDVYYLHHFDQRADLSETMRTLNDFVRSGKVLYTGLSNFAAWQIMKAIAITRQLNLAPVSCIQPMYNLLKRQAESELLPMAADQKIGVFPYSPLAGGLLSGKYLKKKKESSRFDNSAMYQKRYKAEVKDQSIASFVSFARENNFHPVSLAISWVAAHPQVTAPIVGARNLTQLKPVLDSMKIPMTADLRATISDLTPPPALATDREEER